MQSLFVTSEWIGGHGIPIMPAIKEFREEFEPPKPSTTPSPLADAGGAVPNQP